MKRLVAFCLVLAFSLGSPISVAAEEGAVFDFSTNSGFVPVSLVQVVLGLNNGQMKKYAKSVSFPVLLWSTAHLYCDNGMVKDFSYGEGFDVVPSLVQSRKNLLGFQLSGVIENHFFADPEPIEDLCPGPGTPGPAMVTRTLMAGFGGENAILLQEIDIAGD